MTNNEEMPLIVAEEIPVEISGVTIDCETPYRGIRPFLAIPRWGVIRNVKFRVTPNGVETIPLPGYYRNF